MRTKSIMIALFCAVGIGAFAMPAAASVVNLDVQSAYLFALPHGIPPNPDGGSVLINNIGFTAVTIQHVILSGWTSHVPIDFGPAAAPCCTTAPVTGNVAFSALGPGVGSEYNEALSPYPADTSNFGTLNTGPGNGLNVTVSGLDSSSNPFSLTFNDNLPNISGQKYRLTGCVNTGADVECANTSTAYGDMSLVPEPSSLMLLSSGVLGLVGLGTMGRRKKGEAQY